MDDLSGLDWSATPNNQQPAKPPPVNPPSAFSALRPSPSPFGSSPSPSLAAGGTPQSAQPSSSAFRPPPAPASQPKPAHDSFSNLANFGPAKSTAKLSLREQQDRLDAEKRRKEEDKRRLASANYGNAQAWDLLGQGSGGPNSSAGGTPSRGASPAISSLAAAAAAPAKPAESDDDLFAAFNAETKVDNASHYPPPTRSSLSRHASPQGQIRPQPAALDLSSPSAWKQPSAKPAQPAVSSSQGGLGHDDDDPFGLGQMKPQPAPTAAASNAQDNDDDLLGDLGKPVEEVRRKTQAQKPAPEPGKPIEDSDSSSDDEPPDVRPNNSSDPFDKAVAQLVDYGFSPEDARRGLTESGAGLNVQAAANWLLDDAHRKSKEKAQGRRPESRPRDASRPGRAGHNAEPAWMTDGGQPSRADSRSPGQADELAKMAAAAGSNFLKQANTFWKSSQKKVQQAYAEFQHEGAGGDPNQPRWMREAQMEMAREEGQAKAAQQTTDEAMMLDVGQGPPPRQQRQTSRPSAAAAALGTQEAASSSSRPTSRRPSPAVSSEGRHTPVPKWQQSSQTPPLADPRARVNKQAIEDQSAQAYVSPARRRKANPAPPPEPQPQPQEEPDLFNTQALPAETTKTLPERPQRASPATSRSPAPSRNTPSASSKPRPAPTPRPAPSRRIPPVTPAALQTSTRHRTDGTAHFKRGDFAAAHESYASALSAVPQDHPLAILLLCNRALTALKTGEPRQAVADAEAAVKLVGPAHGADETVSLEDGTGETRDMRDLYGKALMRRAEALEQMEKHTDALAAWQACVESGFGGATAIAGRQRCQKTLNPQPAPAPKKPSPAAVRPGPSKTAPPPESTPARGAGRGARPSAGGTPGLSRQQSSDAVNRLRAANQAAEAADSEKFALSDAVDARVGAWRDGKRDNLRALLGSLDQVLWEGSGWKKVGLHELVMPNKVKVVYMKAIAKCHPDKLPQDASTEAKMIAATVFATLNESWDKFKVENKL